MPTLQSPPADESPEQFSRRKQDHIRLSLDEQNEALGGAGLERIALQHEAIPDLDFTEVSLEQQALGQRLPTPLMVSSMTAGHYASLNINLLLAKGCEARGWLMGVGSQRRELTDASVGEEWKSLRSQVPRVKLLGNLGLSQLIMAPTDHVRRLVDHLQAIGMIIHTNPLQECLQPEGTPHFKGAWRALERLCRELDVPVVVKETGCGFSTETLRRLNSAGVTAVDVSGFGGTHWGRIEGQRQAPEEIKARVSQTFSNWGISTLDSLLNAVEIKPSYEVWASGGVRTGLDVARLLAVGARIVGLAKPMLAAVLSGEESLLRQMEVVEYELRTALFCTGSRNPQHLQEKKAWRILAK